MADSPESLAESLAARFEGKLDSCIVDLGEATIEVPREHMTEVCTALRDEPDFAFEILVDLCGVDYMAHGKAEWETEEATARGFSRGVDPQTFGRLAAVERDLSVEGPSGANRFAAVYHLLSVSRNQRLRMRVFAPEDALPVVDSVAGIWSSANWYEREAFDLYGIVFEGHPDLRRILTDYGFVGHPFRKDFPLIGNVEVRYDAERQRVVYQPVSIEPRVLVPKVVRGEPRADEAPPADSAASGSQQ
ncbi:MAG TPA: NADH-quinone oxidoreductase subunit C [Gammaproteobacteria bacterium]|nr:NADH-quinone oxidoreductase subunit C [Gammaproteobacteria bacterium]